MELVLRPVNDHFFQELVLPFLTRAMADSERAVHALLEHLENEQARYLCERLLSSHTGGGLGGLEPEPWAELVDLLAFRQWGPGLGQGWDVVGEMAGYAGDWDEALHLALMLEDATYPYWDERQARMRRDSFRLRPLKDLGLASLMAGVWEPLPEFPPDRVYSTVGRGEYTPRDRYAFADWAWRPARTVVHWHVNLQAKLKRLLERERQRLKPVEMPEEEEVLAWWMGQLRHPPSLTVAFSGLGHRAPAWVQEIGVMTEHLREAARDKAALITLVTRGSITHA